MTKHNNSPALRFPEFEGEWKRKKLNEVATFINGKAYKQEELLEFGKYPVLRVGNFFSNNSWYYSDLELNEDKYCDNGDLLYAWSASFGPKIWDGEKTIYHYHIWKVISSQAIQQKYLFYILDEQTLKMKTNSSNGFALLHITKGTIENWVITLPALPEQSRIATFLTAVDDKLTQLKKKKNLLEEYKKGVMQKLFSQELRFKDENGEEFEEWEEKRLGEIAIKRIIKNTDNKIKNVFTNSAVNGIVNQRDFFDKDIANQNNLTGYYVVEKNDFIYNPRISNFAPVGPISRNHLESGIMSPLYSVFRFTEGNLDFLEWFFNTTIWHKHMEDIANYGARADRMSFPIGDFYKMPIYLPSLPEQTKIATFLNSLDEKISHCGEQIEKMEGWKKGLLQSLFV